MSGAKDTLEGVPLFSDRAYSALAVGDRFGPFEETLGPGVADRLRGELGSSSAGRLAPPGTLPLITLRALRRALDGIIPGGVLFRQRFLSHAEIPAEATVAVELRVSWQERRRGKLYTTFTFTLVHAGAVAATVEWTIIAPPEDEG